MTVLGYFSSMLCSTRNVWDWPAGRLCVAGQHSTEHIHIVSGYAGAFGALLPPDGNWTLALQDMRLSMNVTSRGNSRKDIFALQSVNSTFTRCVCRFDTLRCNNVVAIDYDVSAFLAQASCVKNSTSLLIGCYND